MNEIDLPPITFTEKMYGGYRKTSVNVEDIPLGFITHYTTKKDGEPDAALNKRASTIKNWLGPKNYDTLQVFDNGPRSGFKFGRSVSRWTTNNKFVRVYDPYGFELEITVQNAMYILANCTIVEGVIQNNMRWGRAEGSNWLVPAHTEAYVKAEEKEKEELVSIRDVKYGDIVQMQNSEIPYVYLGHHFVLWNKEIDNINRYPYSKSDETTYTPAVNFKKYHLFTKSQKDYKGRTSILYQSSPKIARFTKIKNQIFFPDEPEDVVDWVNKMQNEFKVFVENRQDILHTFIGLSNNKPSAESFSLNERPFNFKELMNGFVIYDNMLVQRGYSHKEEREIYAPYNIHQRGDSFSITRRNNSYSYYSSLAQTNPANRTFFEIYDIASKLVKVQNWKWQDGDIERTTDSTFNF